MAEIIKQGEVDTTGTLLYTGTNSPLSTKVTIMRFYNPLAYVLTLERYEDATGTTEILYELNLSAGDTVTDDLLYALKYNDTLTIYSDIPGTSYYIYGVDYASS